LASKTNNEDLKNVINTTRDVASNSHQSIEYQQSSTHMLKLMSWMASTIVVTFA